MNRRSFLAASAALASVSNSFAAESKLRVAVIGHTGRGNFGHGLDTVWLKLPETQIVAVADANPTGLASEKEKLKLEAGYAD